MRSNEEQTRLILEKYTAQTVKKQKRKKQAAVVLTVCLCITAFAWLVADSDRNLFVPVESTPNQNDCSGSLEADPTTAQSVQDPTADTAYQSSSSKKGIYIPPIAIPETDDENVVMDMLAMVTYNGRIYVGESVWDPYTLAYNDTNKALLGEYVGTGNGKITCWSDESDYEGNFASNTTWDFYTVNGYDPDFRLAAVMHFSDGSYIDLFDCLNGIYLNKGADLYGTLLHLSGNYGSVFYQLHDDWDYSKGNYKTLDGVTQEELQAFIDKLYESPFTDLSDTEMSSAIFNRKQAHIFFGMHDGTTLGIRLFEGGYVGFTGMAGRVYVYMPSAEFDAVFAAATK